MEKHKMVAETDDTHIVGSHSHAAFRSARMDCHMDQPSVRPLRTARRVGRGFYLWCHGGDLCWHCRYDVHTADYEAGFYLGTDDCPVPCPANGMCRKPEDGLVVLEDGGDTPYYGHCVRTDSQRLTAQYAREIYLPRR